MIILKRSSEKKLPKYTFLGCAVTRHRSAYCRALCRPINGIGACGRLAPHSMISRYQIAIEMQQSAAA